VYQFQSLTFLKLNELVEPVNERDNLANADPAKFRLDADEVNDSEVAKDANEIAADSLGLVITEIELMAKG
jgi:hypothetical protein